MQMMSFIPSNRTARFLILLTTLSSLPVQML